MYFNLYSIYDCVADEASAPFMAKTDGVAIRHFVNGFRKNNPPDVRMEDYWLFRVASYDNETMRIKTLVDPIRVVIQDHLQMESEGEQV
jgi:hypothetical protein